MDVDNLPGDGWTWFGTSGAHTLVVTPYGGIDGSGVVGPDYTVQFSVRAASEQTRLALWEPLAAAPDPQYEGQGVAVDGKMTCSEGSLMDSRSYDSRDRLRSHRQHRRANRRCAVHIDSRFARWSMAPRSIS